MGMMFSLRRLQPGHVRCGPLHRANGTPPRRLEWRPSRKRVENFLLDHMAGLALACFTLAISIVWTSAVLRESEPSDRALSSAVAIAAYEPKQQQVLPIVPERDDDVSTPSTPAATTPALSPKQELEALLTATSASSSGADEEQEREVASQPAPTSLATAKSPAWEFSGKWGPTRAACASNAARAGWLPINITEREARAGDTVCAFGEKRRSGAGWALTASCSSADARWKAKVRLVVQGGKLHWSSERGSQVYVRCDRVNVAAR